MISSSDILQARILVVDDQETNVRLLERMLSGAGYTCVSSTMNPRAVCELHRKNRYDLILLDLLMPHMDGFQVMEGLKDIEKDGYLPVLVITAQPGHKLLALQAGAKDFISKPIELAEVQARVHNMLEVRLLHLEAVNNSALLKETVDRLQKVERLKNGFLSTVSHELRTPLTAIRGSLGLLASGAVGALSDEGVEVVAIAERNAIRLITLINDILDVERLETGMIELQFAQVSVESILRRATESLPTSGQAHGITVEAPEMSSMIWADADRIVQALVNLLSNAVKFSPSGGVVTLGVTLQDGWAEFRVTDHGRGVPAGHLPLIFERFRQVETSDSRQKGGAGLGLAICKSIVEQHGGTIGVESEEGRGSSFWFRVATTLAPAMPRLGRAILLCADDADRRGFVDVIRQAGYTTVITVPDADAAWDVLHTGDVAVVLLKGDSELLARMRNEPAFGVIPVILFGSPLVVTPAALSDSLVLFLPERVDIRELLAEIRDDVERGRAAAPAGYVLLVEDDVTLLDIMARQLFREGITVRTAATGEEATRHPRLRGERDEDGALVRQLAAPDAVLLLRQDDDGTSFWCFVCQRRQLCGIGQFAVGDARHRHELGRLAVAERNRARLVEEQRVDVAGRLDRAAGHREDVPLHQPVHARDADGRQQSADRRRDETHEQRDEDEHCLRRPGIQREGLQRDDREQEDDRQAGEQDIEGDLVRCLLALGAFDQRDHPIEKAVAGVGGDADFDPVREDARAAGDGGPVAAGLADDRCGLAGDGRFVHRRHAVDDLAVAGNELAGAHEHDVALLQRLRRNGLRLAPADDEVRAGLGSRFAQCVRLGFAATFRHRLGEVGEQHGEPEPERDLELEAQVPPARDGVTNQVERRQQASDLDDEHHRVLRHRSRVQLPERIANRRGDDGRIPDGECLRLSH